jgi:hypothetical protein
LGYDRIFCGKSDNWFGSSLASLQATGRNEDVTFGAVVELNDEELKLLDGFEVHPTVYKREEIEVYLRIANKWEAVATKAICYIKVDSKWTTEPHEEYLTACQMLLNETYQTGPETVLSIKGIDESK